MFKTTPLAGVLLIEPRVFRDDRGFFLESFNERRFREAGLDVRFVQDNHSRSARGTLRGLHAQLRHPQGKLVRVIEGEVFDVCVDIRRGSPTYRKWYGVRLSQENFLELYIPPGYAHGFYVLSPFAQFEYKCTDFYDPADELHVIWNDNDIGIEWPDADPRLSPKDAAGARLKDIEPQLPTYDPKRKS
ncbi:MAG TPA: dTDP-4-dehydrorhamnose 3,5-epimerase [Elusimicrobiota bacterium]|nr:dTDP-4-dehydrorhamnose 3,5-epimerase [Elusimicrobiota bacterium]